MLGSPEQSAHIIFYVLISVFIMIGIGCIIYGVTVLNEAKRSRSWKRVIGVICQSEVRLAPVDQDSVGGSKPDVKYKYTVGGKSYTGDLIAFGLKNFHSSNTFANKYTQHYKVGANVYVYYDPDDISRSVLEPGVSSRTYIPMWLGTGFIIAGLFFLFVISSVSNHWTQHNF